MGTLKDEAATKQNTIFCLIECVKMFHFTKTFPVFVIHIQLQFVCCFLMKIFQIYEQKRFIISFKFKRGKNEKKVCKK